MKLIIISGRSGSGKSTALHVLEDLDYYCIDNMPSGLLPALIDERQCDVTPHDGIAISIDARNAPGNLKSFSEIITSIDKTDIEYTIVYLDADDKTILTRFSATRRKHPLSSDSVSLEEAIKKERNLLSPIAALANFQIDTRNLSLQQLREIIKKRVAGQTDTTLALLFKSFGFKHGIPNDADFVFDVRCLPNPFWNPKLREYDGRDQPIIKFLEEYTIVEDMFTDLDNYLDKWLPEFEVNNRSYITVAIGCTGGHHRSVYLSERLAKHFSEKLNNVQIRHRDIDKQS